MEKIIALLFLFTSLRAEAQIITTDKISDIEVEFAKADSETLVVFDYDDVLTEPVDLALLTINEDVSEKIADDIILNRDMKTQLVQNLLELSIYASKPKNVLR